jgi:hypothetical protein
MELFHDIPKISCPKNNAQIFIGTENYFPNADGFLMPAMGQLRTYHRIEKDQEQISTGRKFGADIASFTFSRLTFGRAGPHPSVVLSYLKYLRSRRLLALLGGHEDAVGAHHVVLLPIARWGLVSGQFCSVHSGKTFFGSRR